MVNKNLKNIVPVTLYSGKQGNGTGEGYLWLIFSARIKYPLCRFVIFSSVVKTPNALQKAIGSTHIFPLFSSLSKTEHSVLTTCNKLAKQCHLSLYLDLEKKSNCFNQLQSISTPSNNRLNY